MLIVGQLDTPECIDEVLVDLVLGERPDATVDEAEVIVGKFLSKNYDKAQDEAVRLNIEARSWFAAYQEAARGY